MKTLLALLFLLAGCQLAPTKAKDEVVSREEKAVVVDTRGALAFASYHVSGSVSLSSSDFLLLKNIKIQKRILDPDLEQTVERLAKKGISPLKKIVLLGDKADSLENKKWRWLLSELGVNKVETTSLDEFRAARKSLIPQADPERADVWTIENADEIIRKSDTCFVSWSDSACH